MLLHYGCKLKYQDVQVQRVKHLSFLYTSLGQKNYKQYGDGLVKSQTYNVV